MRRTFATLFAARSIDTFERHISFTFSSRNRRAMSAGMGHTFIVGHAFAHTGGTVAFPMSCNTTQDSIDQALKGLLLIRALSIAIQVTLEVGVGDACLGIWAIERGFLRTDGRNRLDIEGSIGLVI